jgi:AraC-like DNA-binding protein
VPHDLLVTLNSSVAADTFADFVDHLAEVLGQADDVSGDDLAARFHFSRFHFDRMIRSVAGEPPQAFRRRILLERAAYRMVTTRAPLIDIAVEAGYGSHEAFTRAFTRAYGVAPAAWRRSPGRIRIAAPSDVHFHPPGSLRLPARDKVTAMDLMTRMVEHHIWLTARWCGWPAASPTSSSTSRSGSTSMTTSRRSAPCCRG